MPGDTLTTQQSTYFCNGKYLGEAKPMTMKDEPLTQFVFNGTIRAGQAFLMTPHPDGFDSRYWGFASMDKLQKVRPLF